MNHNMLVEDVNIPQIISRKHRRNIDGSWIPYQFHHSREYLMMIFNCAFTVTGFYSFVVRSKSDNEPCLIHHLVSTVFVALPLVYMQTYLGHYTQLGVIMFKSICPIVHGIGYVYLVITVYWCANNGLILSDIFMYFTASLDGIAEFTTCPPNSSSYCWDQHSSCTNNCITDGIYPATFIYWQNLFMDEINIHSTDLSFGKPMPTRFVPLLLVWVILFFILIMNPKDMRKLVKICNYVILFFGTSFMLVCFLTTGASYGIRMLFQFNSRSFVNISAWSRSIYIVIRTLALDKICYMMYGTHLQPSMSSDVLSIVTVVFIFLLSMICAVVSHALIGIVLVNAHCDENAMQHLWFKGMSPHFTIFFAAIGFIGVSDLWAVVYFMVCILVMSNNLIVQVDGIEMCLSDTHQSLRPYRKYIRASTCILCALFGILCSSKEAHIVLKVLFRRALVYVSCFNLFLMSVVVCWLYGVERLSDDIHFFKGLQPTRFWKICWYLLPCLILIPCVQADLRRLKMKEEVFVKLYYPLILIFQLPLPIMTVYEICQFIKVHNLLGLFQPNARWGPLHIRDRHLRQMFNPRKEIRSRRRTDICTHKCLLKNQFIDKLIFLEQDARENFIRPIHSTMSIIDRTAGEMQHAEWNVFD